MFPVFDLLVLSQIPNIGPNRLRVLISHFGDPSVVVESSPREIAAVEGFSKKLASEIVHFIGSSGYKDAKNYAELQLSRLNKAGGRIVTFWDKEYPDLLKKIYDPPPFLFVRGDFAEQDRFAIAIVGTRSPTPYGTTIAGKFVQEFCKIGIPVVSGLARGVDTIVHASTLKAGGRTIAVIGSGLDVPYPPENRNLFERIAAHGAVISEYEMGTKPDAGNFPRRNRIISGLSLGTLVIETDVNGGAMITANTALDQNREVFAVPGNVGVKQSRGCHALVKSGRAKLVECFDDILAELASKLRPLVKDSVRQESAPSPDLTLFEKAIWDVLSDEPRHIDSIAESAKLSTSDALVHLLNLEFKGLVQQMPGKMFVRS
ncbi:MAG: DNA-processing protein DprA [Bacteroidota bacterium]|jgi:DNA processing protein